MRKFLFPTLIVLLTGLALAFAPNKAGEEYVTLEIGENAKLIDREMTSIDGNNFSLQQLKKAKGLLVIFSCNTCPFVIAWEDRYPELARLAEENEIGFGLINSNEAKREGDDSMNEMIDHAKQKGYGELPYLIDKDSELANAFGAKTTPHVFLFDKDLKLVYEGAIDDNYKSKDEVSAFYLKDALENLGEGKAIDPNQTKALGCSIKRVKI